ncbi:hypothetical protein SGLAM104S_01410 [Streptomyces glaucescens]
MGGDRRLVTEALQQHPHRQPGQRHHRMELRQRSRPGRPVGQQRAPEGDLGGVARQRDVDGNAWSRRLPRTTEVAETASPSPVATAQIAHTGRMTAAASAGRSAISESARPAASDCRRRTVAGLSSHGEARDRAPPSTDSSPWSFTQACAPPSPVETAWLNSAALAAGARTAGVSVIGRPEVAGPAQEGSGAVDEGVCPADGHARDRSRKHRAGPAEYPARPKDYRWNALQTFCAVVADPDRARVVHEDAHTVAFFPLTPATCGDTPWWCRGRTPADLWEMTGAEVGRLMRTPC